MKLMSLNLNTVYRIAHSSKQILSSTRFIQISNHNRRTFVHNRTTNQKRWYSSHTKSELTSEEKEILNGPRDSDAFDVVIVGAGPSGLSAAIKLKQLSKDLRVCVVEKGPEVGSHILAGAVIEPKALNELIPSWKERRAPLITEAKDDRFYLLTQNQSIRLPTPPTMHNEGNYIISLANFCRWLGTQAEELGVEIYPGFAASEVLYNSDGSIKGIATSDMGIGKNGKPTENFTRGMELHSKVTLFAEGCRGSLTKTLYKKFGLRNGVDPQSFGIGIKELWTIPASQHKQGLVIHTVGWPMDFKTYGGAFIYHLENNQVALGYVVGLDYTNPYLNPYKEFQRFKHHPLVKPMLEGGRCDGYGARAINEGGFQAIPNLSFPGGALIGCTAGFLNTPKVKGIHNAMKTGMIAAESIVDNIKKGPENQTLNLVDYNDRVKNSWVWEDLYRVRNIFPGFQYGLLPGIFNAAFEAYITRGKSPWTLRMKKPDHDFTKLAAESTPIEYPKPDGKISFDLLTNLQRSGTNHSENQPAHLKVRDPELALKNYKEYAAPESRFCPAGVYEWIENEKGKPQLQINAQNCLHCKTCDIKDKFQNIDYTVPEGGGGPKYGSM